MQVYIKIYSLNEEHSDWDSLFDEPLHDQAYVELAECKYSTGLLCIYCHIASSSSTKSENHTKEN